MNNRYNFIIECPTVDDYEDYLQGKRDGTFNKAFNNHLENCEICTTAVQGFKLNNTTTINNLLLHPSKQFSRKIGKSKIQLFKTLRYAASIIILLGISSVLYIINNKNIANYQAMSIDYSMFYETVQPNNNKTLVRKSTEQFIYINNCSQIAYNDQYLDSEKLVEVLKKQETTTLITVEVGVSDHNCANTIINAIKNNQSAPVISIRKTK